MTVDRTRQRARPFLPVIITALFVATIASFGPTTVPVRAASAATTPAASTDGPTVLGPTIKFYGRGYGHGVGMSQYGARGRALAGEDAPTILAHYYDGTTLGSIDPNTPIRIRVLWKWKATASAPLLIYGRGSTWTIDGIDGVFPAGAALRVIPTTATGKPTTWRVRVSSKDGSVLLDIAKPADLLVRPTLAGGRLQLASKPTTYDKYRGSLRVITAPTAPKLKVVNEVGIDTYLRGVVPAEMPSTWPTAALEAQSIAARSYAARRLRPGVSYYDVVDTSASQVYLGKKGERASTNATISTTAGIVLMSGDAIANALFHSTGGGATESNENVFTSSTGAIVAGPVSYLRGSVDRAPDGSAYDAAAPYATWHTRRYTIGQVSAWFAADKRTAVGTLTALDLGDIGVSGRLISVTLIGTSGTKQVSGAVFRSVFNAGRPKADPMMRSTLFALAPIP